MEDVIYFGILVITWVTKLKLRRFLNHFKPKRKGYNFCETSRFNYHIFKAKSPNYRSTFLLQCFLTCLQYFEHNSTPRPPNDLILTPSNSKNYKFCVFLQELIWIYSWSNPARILARFLVRFLAVANLKNQILEQKQGSNI